MLTATHIRAARSLLGVRQSDLARAAGISLATLNNIERGVGDPRTSTLRAIGTALDQAGVIIDDSAERTGVAIERLRRPRLHEPYQASEAIMTAIGPRALFIAEAVIAFGRASGGQNEASTVPQFGIALSGPVRTQIFDRANLALDSPTGAAEVCGILLAAFAYRRPQLRFIGHVLEDTTLLSDYEVLAQIEGARSQPMIHPAQIIDVIDDWARLSVTYMSWKSHPARDLLRSFGPAPARSQV